MLPTSQGKMLFSAFVVVSVVLIAPGAVLKQDPHQRPAPAEPRNDDSQAAISPRKNEDIVPAGMCTIEAHPYVVSFIAVPSNSWFCQGTLLSDVWVLTAAHCFYTPDDLNVGCSNASFESLQTYRPKYHHKPEIHLETGFRMHVEAGVANRDRKAETPEVRLVSDIYIQEDFEVDTHGAYYGDVAMVKLQQPLVRSTTVGYAALPTFIGEVYPPKRRPTAKLYVVGIDGGLTCHTNIVVYEPDVCKEKYHFKTGKVPDFKTMVCIKLDGGKSVDDGAIFVDNYTSFLGMSSFRQEQLYFVRVDAHLGFVKKLLYTLSGSSQHFNNLQLPILSVCLFNTL